MLRPPRRPCARPSIQGSSEARPSSAPGGCGATRRSHSPAVGHRTAPVGVSVPRRRAVRDVRRGNRSGPKRWRDVSGSGRDPPESLTEWMGLRSSIQTWDWVPGMDWAKNKNRLDVSSVFNQTESLLHREGSQESTTKWVGTGSPGIIPVWVPPLDDPLPKSPLKAPRKKIFRLLCNGSLHLHDHFRKCKDSLGQ